MAAESGTRAPATKIRSASVGDRLHAVFQRQAGAAPASSVSPLYSQVYQTIREALLLGIMGPGETVSTRVVAAALGTSAMPAREALGRLVMDGALESLPNRAFRVPLMSPTQFRELLLMRLRLETLAAEHAAVRVQASQLLRLRAFFDELAANESPSATLAKYLEAHRQFHFEIYRIAEMPNLYQAIENLWLRAGPLFNEASITFNYPEKTEFHAEIFRAIEICDPKAASAAIEGDLTSAGRRAMLLLEETGQGRQSNGNQR